MNKKILVTLNKIYKRKINTGLLQELMNKMLKNNTLKISNSNNEEFLEKMNKLKEKVEIKVNNEKYETIQENLNESLKIMKELNSNFKNIKEKSFNIEVKIEDTKEFIKKDKIENLNIENKYHQQDTVNLNNIKKNDNEYFEDMEQIKNTINNSKKSIFDISWLQPFIDFMHNHSTLVLTIGSGIVMGGMWYMNHVGIINIGSLLTRLGIQIFSVNGQNMNTSQNERYLPLENERIQNGEISRGFFRELGVKVLKLIDILIEKMEKGRQKYK